MNQDPLAQLRGIHLPEAISWWPPAIGWWLLLLLIIIVIAIVVWAIKVYQRKQLRQAIIENELNQLLNDYKSKGDFQAYVQALSELLKRSAINLRGDKHVATYSGEQWQEYIRQFSSPSQQVLCDYFGNNIYKAKGSGDVTGLQKFAKQWINTDEKLAAGDA